MKNLLEIQEVQEWIDNQLAETTLEDLQTQLNDNPDDFGLSESMLELVKGFVGEHIARQELVKLANQQRFGESQ